MELSNIPLAELKQLLESIPTEIKRREKDEKAQVLKDLQAFAAERGFLLQDLLGESKEKKVGKPVAIKYRHPEKAELAWTGRGRQPKWVVEFISNGGSLDQLTV